MPTVSIIVPAYNAESSIRRCVQSILDQTYTDFELLAMDDGSSDSTGQILDQLAASDARVHVVHKKNSGVSDTRNQALDLARGRYIQFLDADDWIAPMTTDFYVHAMEDHPECDMVISDFYRVIGQKLSQKGDIDEEGLVTREEYAQAMMRNPADFYYGVVWNKFYRRDIIEADHIRMDTRLSWSEDFIFNMEYVLHTEHIYVLKYPTYYYVKTKGSLVSSQGASLSKTVRMKLAVIEYYTNFYKNIYKDGGYLRRAPAVYYYLLDSAHDGGVSRISPDGTLAKNPMDVDITPDMADNPYAFCFYESQFLADMARRLEKGYDLDERDIGILLYMKLAGKAVPAQSIRNFTGLSQNAVRSSLQKLLRRELIEKEKTERNAAIEHNSAVSENTAITAAEIVTPETTQAQLAVNTIDNKTPAESLSHVAGNTDRKRYKSHAAATLYQFCSNEKSSRVQESLDHLFRDTQEILLHDMSAQEQAVFGQLSQKAAQNMHAALAAPGTG